MIEPGRPAPLGATVDKHGVNFALFSLAADRVELCLFDATGREQRLFLPAYTDGVWHGYLPGCAAGQHYGFRVHGPWAPEAGQRCNPAKLLVDPYARALAGEFAWNDAVYDYDHAAGIDAHVISIRDSAPYVPKSVVTGPAAAAGGGPGIPWSQTVFYETNVRGYTMQHPALDRSLRGTFDGLRHVEVIGYLKALGVSSIELMPVHAFIDEEHLARLGLRNFWGYNSISFFAPAPRYGREDPVREFRDMVRALHDAGLEVILDVVYNHTGEGGYAGPTICFRGIDNLSYYSTEPGVPGAYINDTGCGNTVNADQPQVRQLVLDSLRYWHRDMGVDGFRFDLAPVLGRHNHGFSAAHPLLTAIGDDPALASCKLIAEPWDPGPGGYQLGNFPPRWAEWNDRYRDAVRRFWRGDAGTAAEFAARLRGSAEIFEASGRGPEASVNIVTTHDGFTLADVVSYAHRHNEANGENNRDGHAHNYSDNLGIEGPSPDPAIQAARRRRRLNMLATLLVSQGTPLLLAGDEFGNSQLGNNNAYAQDNPMGWIDWSGLEDDPDFTRQVRNLLALRKSEPLLRALRYVHGSDEWAGLDIEVNWLRPDGESVTAKEWPAIRAFTLLLRAVAAVGRQSQIAVLVNGSAHGQTFALPSQGDWQLAFCSSTGTVLEQAQAAVAADSLAILQAAAAG